MHRLINRYWGIVAISGFLYLAVLSCATTGAVSGNKSVMDLETLYSSLGIPSNCGPAPAWEAKGVTVQGFVDPDNIFDRQHFPNLPYEKFRVIDREGRSLEVWVKASDSRAIFSRVYQKKSSQIIISGRLAVVKMPIMGKCQLGAKVWINDPSQIQ